VGGNIFGWREGVGTGDSCSPSKYVKKALILR